MKFFRINKWEKFQHYHDPRPPWLKVYTKINDFKETNDWRPLLDHELGQLIRMAVYAAMNDNTLPYHAELLQETLECDQPINLDKFNELGVIQVFPSREDCLSREKTRVLSRKKTRENPSAPRSEVRDQSSERKDQSSESRDQKGTHTMGDVKANKNQMAYVRSLLKKTDTNVTKWKKRHGVKGPLMNSHVDEIVSQCARGEISEPKLTAALIGSLEFEFNDGGNGAAQYWISHQKQELGPLLHKRLSLLVERDGG